MPSIPNDALRFTGGESPCLWLYQGARDLMRINRLLFSNLKHKVLGPGFSPKAALPDAASGARMPERLRLMRAHGRRLRDHSRVLRQRSK
jgi:hypothetical protein